MLGCKCGTIPVLARMSATDTAAPSYPRSLGPAKTDIVGYPEAAVDLWCDLFRQYACGSHVAIVPGQPRSCFPASFGTPSRWGLKHITGSRRLLGRPRGGQNSGYWRNSTSAAHLAFIDTLKMTDERTLLPAKSAPRPGSPVNACCRAAPLLRRDGCSSWVTDCRLRNPPSTSVACDTTTAL